MKDVMYPNEKWRNIYTPDVFGKYQISNYGRVKNKSTGVYQESHINSNGYRFVLLTKEENEFHIWIHRSVAIRFVYCENYMTHTEVWHKNLNKNDNRAENLEWVTKEEFDRRVLSMNTPKLSSFYEIYFTDEIVEKVCKALEDGRTYENICIDILHTSMDKALQKRIHRIHHHKVFNHISSKYNF